MCNGLSNKLHSFWCVKKDNVSHNNSSSWLAHCWIFQTYDVFIIYQDFPALSLIQNMLFGTIKKFLMQSWGIVAIKKVDYSWISIIELNHSPECLWLEQSKGNLTTVHASYLHSVLGGNTQFFYLKWVSSKLQVIIFYLSAMSLTFVLH